MIYDIFSEKLKYGSSGDAVKEFIDNYHTDLIFSKNIAQLNSEDGIFGISKIVSFISENSSAIEDGRVIFKSIDDENTFYNMQDREGTYEHLPYTLNKLPYTSQDSIKKVIHDLLGKLGYYNFNNHLNPAI